MKCNEFINSDIYVKDKFCVSTKTKKRYINPLTENGRIYDTSEKAKNIIDNFINTKVKKYV